MNNLAPQLEILHSQANRLEMLPAPQLLEMLQLIAPYSLMIVIGFLLARHTKINQRLVAQALVYFFTPAVIGFGILKSPLKDSDLLLPLIFFMLCLLFALCARAYLKNKISAEDRAVLAYGSGSGNTGYFGLPMTIAVLGPEHLGTAILCAFGFTFFENTIGYYIISRGKFTPLQSFKRLFKLPSFYAFHISIILNYFGGVTVSPESPIGLTLDALRVIYSILGMMMLGFGIASIRGVAANWLQVRYAIFNKFVLWPTTVGALIFIDAQYIHLLGPSHHAVMLLMSLVPYPANSIAFSMELRLPTAQISLVLLITTLMSFFLIPAIFGVLASLFS
jgi:predicted permease